MSFSCMPKEFFKGDGKGNIGFDSRYAQICPGISGQFLKCLKYFILETFAIIE